MELKEAEEKSLKESERLEKEIAEVQELKVGEIMCKRYYPSPVLVFVSNVLTLTCYFLDRKRLAQ